MNRYTISISSINRTGTRQRRSWSVMSTIGVVSARNSVLATLPNEADSTRTP